MNQFGKALLITMGINVFVFAIGFVEPGFFVLFLVLTVLEFFGGLLMLISKDSRQTAAGVIAAAGLTFLIGFSICSTMSFGHF